MRKICRTSLGRRVAVMLASLGCLFSSSAFAGGTPPPVACGDSADADIVIMIDRTGSISSSEMAQEKNAAKTLLQFFDGALVQPRVSIGTFNVQSGPDARILASLTDLYGQDNPGNTGLFQTINEVVPSSGSGNTDISAAITVAQAELAANAQSVDNRFIIIISDGITNEPDASDPSSCSAGNPGAAASDAADAAELAGTKIFAIHFGDDSPCASGTGVTFLQNIIATAPTMYYEGNSDLSGVFTEISEAIVCDDGNTCTRDSCDNNICVWTPIGDDSDGDGVADCLDQCPGGDDTLLGDECSSGVGACQNSGVKICQCLNSLTPNGTSCQVVCNAQPGDPTAESCNGIDDDCDELVDEEFPVGETCMTGVGLCMNTGQYECAQDGSAQCNATPGSPSEEICDGLDNDCDDLVDEEIPSNGDCSVGVGACAQSGQLMCTGGAFVCDATPGKPSEEVCDGIDNDCDGEIDENIPSQGACTEGEGVCEAAGELVCLRGSFVCDATPGTPSEELCDGLDNDCDSSIDEEIPSQGDCTAGEGACQANGQLLCVKGAISCDATAGKPTEEICDGIDNDCDGQIDEEIPSQGNCSEGQGVCQAEGQLVCSGGAIVCDATPGTPSEELCDGLDNDCDGSTDEEIPSQGDCSAGQGQCQEDGQLLCTGGAFVCSAIPGDPIAEICNGLDDDCNGVVDNDIPSDGACSVGTGVCQSAGVFICTGGTYACDATPGLAGTEICNGLDDDCDGTTDEIFDTCGVQCGDGSTCACEIQEFGGQILTIDGNADAIFKYGQLIGKHALRAVDRGRGKKGLTYSKAKTIVNNILAQLSAIKNDTWTRVNVELPKFSEVCGSAYECVNVNNISTLDVLRGNTTQSGVLANRIIKRLGVAGEKKIKELRAILANLLAQTAGNINSFPTESSNCEPVT